MQKSIDPGKPAQIGQADPGQNVLLIAILLLHWPYASELMSWPAVLHASICPSMR